MSRALIWSIGVWWWAQLAWAQDAAPSQRVTAGPPDQASAAAAGAASAVEAAQPAGASQVPEPDAPAAVAATALQPASDQQALEAEFAQAPERDQPQTPESAPVVATQSQKANVALLDLSFDLLAAGGGSSARDDEMLALQAGGHDPKQRGFTIQNAELTLSGVVDPYLRGDAYVVLQIDPDGESTIELEEAYLSSLDLPFNLQLKGGQFLGAFGRINTVHPHAWDFVDQPVVISRLLGGDGFRNPGVQLSWLTPLPFFTELIASVHNSQGETAASFRAVPGDSLAGRTLQPRGVHDLGDLLYLLRLRSSLDFGDEVTAVGGVSALFGPNATGDNTATQIYGADLYVKWKPLANDHGWPFLGWQTELLYRRYEAAPVLDQDVLLDPRRNLRDLGLYSQLVWGFARPWTFGVRFDYARASKVSFGDYDSTSDPERDQRQRYSAALTYYPSEFSKLRLQYNYDRAGFLAHAHAHSVFLQGEVLFGVHGAHRF